MIRVHNLTKSFKLYHSPADRLKEIVFGRRYYKEFTALKDVSFEVAAGETLGIIGQNGAGKSTLLKLLMGILLPDSGEMYVDGKITGLLELTTGFNFEFNGVQNIYLNGTLRGMSKQEIDAKLEQIIQFSELDGFIYEPIKTYSSGMVMRLAFSTAIHADPQAFVVDEALSVGDAYFQQKCKKKMMEFKERGGSLVFVSHDLNSVKMLCDRAILLDHGQIVECGEPEQVINTYNFLLAKKSEGEEIQLRKITDKGKSYGNFKMEITSVKMLNKKGQNCEVFVSGEKCTIQVMLKAQESVKNVTIGVLIRDRFGQDIFGTNTYYLKIPVSVLAGEDCMVEYVFNEFNIGHGKYTLTVAAHTFDVHVQECYHWVDMIKTFEVVGNPEFYFIGLSRLNPWVQVYQRVKRTVIDKPLTVDSCKAEISVIENPQSVIKPRSIFPVKVKIKNIGTALWPALGTVDGKYWIQLGYHIYDKNGNAIIFNGERVALPCDLAPDKEVIISSLIRSPENAGEYNVEFDMVQEMVTWFADQGSQTAKIAIKVQQ